uniref:Uncharacterized protein n=1 Tax=Cacopsylla melanoneura TaxID=428564 RepID=A0A8D8Q2T2_9HEMI
MLETSICHYLNSWLDFVQKSTFFKITESDVLPPQPSEMKQHVPSGVHARYLMVLHFLYADQVIAWCRALLGFCISTSKQSMIATTFENRARNEIGRLRNTWLLVGQKMNLSKHCASFGRMFLNIVPRYVKR